MIRRPDHRLCVDVETSPSRSWLVQLVADALRKASQLAWSHRARNGSGITKRQERQLAEDAGDGHSPYVRISIGQVHHPGPDMCCAVPPRPAFVWTVVPQGLNHRAFSFHEPPCSLRYSANMGPEQEGNSESPMLAIVHRWIETRQFTVIELGRRK